MNCKPGDLAVIRASYKLASERGRIVEVVCAGAFGEEVRMKSGDIAECRGSGGVGWLCDAHSDEYPCFIADEHLYPLRGNEEEDETLTWAGKPECAPA